MNPNIYIRRFNNLRSGPNNGAGHSCHSWYFFSIACDSGQKMNEQIVMSGLYNDAVFLRQNGRLRGCLCLLLCLIDGLVKRKYPKISGNRERYVKYLKLKLKSLGIDESVMDRGKGCPSPSVRDNIRILQM